ncbi:MAG: hypothetical protein M3P43_07915, partial [Actinomycetota bacterium]|nr:hypothetical protein [Actinomycetota bacterium]
MTFFASGEETDFLHGSTVTTDFTDLDTEFPAVPGHYRTDEILGFPAPPGVAFQIQVAFPVGSVARSRFAQGLRSELRRGPTHGSAREPRREELANVRGEQVRLLHVAHVPG